MIGSGKGAHSPRSHITQLSDPFAEPLILTSRLQQAGSRPCSVSSTSPDIGILYRFFEHLQVSSSVECESLVTGHPSPGTRSKFRYCHVIALPMSVLFLAFQTVVEQLSCRSRGSLRGTLNLTFDRSFSYSYSKVFVPSFSTLGVRHRRKSNVTAELVMQRRSPSVYHVSITDPPGHSWSGSRILHSLGESRLY